MALSCNFAVNVMSGGSWKSTVLFLYHRPNLYMCQARYSFRIFYLTTVKPEVILRTVVIEYMESREFLNFLLESKSR